MTDGATTLVPDEIPVSVVALSATLGEIISLALISDVAADPDNIFAFLPILVPLLALSPR